MGTVSEGMGWGGIEAPAQGFYVILDCDVSRLSGIVRAYILCFVLLDHPSVVITQNDHPTIILNDHLTGASVVQRGTPDTYLISVIILKLRVKLNSTQTHRLPGVRP